MYSDNNLNLVNVNNDFDELTKALLAQVQSAEELANALTGFTPTEGGAASKVPNKPGLLGQMHDKLGTVNDLLYRLVAANKEIDGAINGVPDTTSNSQKAVNLSANLVGVSASVNTTPLPTSTTPTKQVSS